VTLMGSHHGFINTFGLGASHMGFWAGLKEKACPAASRSITNCMHTCLLRATCPTRPMGSSPRFANLFPILLSRIVMSMEPFEIHERCFTSAANGCCPYCSGDVGALFSKRILWSSVLSKTKRQGPLLLPPSYPETADEYRHSDH